MKIKLSHSAKGKINRDKHKAKNIFKNVKAFKEKRLNVNIGRKETQEFNR